MIDLINYKRAIEWLQRGIDAQASQSLGKLSSDGLLHSVEVTYNTTEAVLRQALVLISNDEEVIYLSSGELMRYAVDEGIPLASAESWLGYGLALERANATLGDSFSEDVLPFLSQYVAELWAFEMNLAARLNANA